MNSSLLKANALKYVRQHHLRLAAYLGGGTDGCVWKTNRITAVKVLQRQRNYLIELACYQRLAEHKITKIGRFAVPRLVGWDDGLKAIEMSMVSPPFLIDFGKAYLDKAPDYSAEAWADYHEAQEEIWGDRYEEVQGLLWQLRRIGIHYTDPNTKNIIFIEEDLSDNPPQALP